MTLPSGSWFKKCKLIRNINDNHLLT
jgi:hypothetical protein